MKECCELLILVGIGTTYSHGGPSPMLKSQSDSSTQSSSKLRRLAIMDASSILANKRIPLASVAH